MVKYAHRTGRDADDCNENRKAMREHGFFSFNLLERFKLP